MRPTYMFEKIGTLQALAGLSSDSILMPPAQYFSELELIDTTPIQLVPG